MISRRRRVSFAIVCAACACALGCQGYRLHMAIEEPAPLPVAAKEAAQVPPIAAPETPPPEAPKATARERSKQLGELYREWKAGSDFLARRLEKGLETPAIVREDLADLREQLLAFLPLLDEPFRAQACACTDEYGPIADRHAAGKSRETALHLKTLTRKVQRIME